MLPVIPTFLFTLLLISLLVPVAKKVGLVDIPNNRKLHTGSVPLVGGIAIYIAILTYFLLFDHFNIYTIGYIIGASLLLLVGILDDMYDIRVRYRLLVQFASALIITWSGAYIGDVGYIDGIGIISFGGFGIVVTILLIITNINSFNMVDGVDGLLGMLSLISMITLAIFLSLAGSSFTIIPIVTSGAVIAYLVFNLKLVNFIPKVFVGDSGAMLLGFTISWLATIGTVVEHAFRPVTILYIVAVPLIDLIFNIFNRIRKGQSPIRPARDHIHHRLMDRGYSSIKTVVIVSALAVFISAVGFVGEYFEFSDLIMLFNFSVIMACFASYFVFTSEYKTS